MGLFDRDIIYVAVQLVLLLVALLLFLVVVVVHCMYSSTFHLEVSIWHVASTAAQSGTCSNAQLNVRKRAVLERRLLSPLQIEHS